MGLLKLLALCAFMFASSLAVGLIPLFFSLSPRHLRYVTTIGVGLLVGVAFIVIIPEGVHTYYGANSPSGSAHSHAHSHAEHDSAPLSTLSPSPTPSSPSPSPLSFLPSTDDSAFSHSHAGEEDAILPPSHTHPDTDASDLTDDPLDLHPTHTHTHTADPDEDGHSHTHPTRHLLHADHPGAEEGGGKGEGEVPCPGEERNSGMVGLALVSGFVLMLLVDRVSGGHGHAHGGGTGGGGGGRRGVGKGRGEEVKVDIAKASVALSPPPSNSAPQLPSASPATSIVPRSLPSPHLHPHPPSLPPHPPTSSSSSYPPTSTHSNTALLGILTHSAIDGLALGAISVSENAALELVVFLAIILHKGPAAFGLASFLLYQGRGRGEVRWLLTVFSAAAPLTSLVTFLLFWQGEVIRQARSEGGEGGAAGASGGGGLGPEMLGLCLLFSAGTFLFTIAAHILPEISKKEGATEWRFITCLVVGILIPLALGGHHHH